MELHILKYNINEDYYTCRDEFGVTHRVDLHVSGSKCIKKYTEKYREKLIGKTVVVDRLIAYLELANEVCEVK